VAEDCEWDHSFSRGVTPSLVPEDGQAHLVPHMPEEEVVWDNLQAMAAWSNSQATALELAPVVPTMGAGGVRGGPSNEFRPRPFREPNVYSVLAQLAESPGAHPRKLSTSAGAAQARREVAIAAEALSSGHSITGKAASVRGAMRVGGVAFGGGSSSPEKTLKARQRTPSPPGSASSSRASPRHAGPVASSLGGPFVVLPTRPPPRAQLARRAEVRKRWPPVAAATPGKVLRTLVSMQVASSERPLPARTHFDMRRVNSESPFELDAQDYFTPRNSNHFNAKPSEIVPLGTQVNSRDRPGSPAQQQKASTTMTSLPNFEPTEGFASEMEGAATEGFRSEGFSSEGAVQELLKPRLSSKGDPMLSRAEDRKQKSQTLMRQTRRRLMEETNNGLLGGAAFLDDADHPRPPQKVTLIARYPRTIGFCKTFAPVAALWARGPSPSLREGAGLPHSNPWLP